MMFLLLLYSVLFLGLYSGTHINIGIQAISIPVSILLGIITGAIIGFIMVRIFKKYHIRDTKKGIIDIRFITFAYGG